MTSNMDTHTTQTSTLVGRSMRCVPFRIVPEGSIASHALRSPYAPHRQASLLALLSLVFCFADCFGAVYAQMADVSASVVLQRANNDKPASGSADVVVWLTPLDTSGEAMQPQVRPHFTLTQKDKMFHPHLLVVPVGSGVDFPNLDPFFHNVFSLFNGKRFDLGLYDSHSRRTVRFDREGVSYIFCNIHPDMAAVIVSLSTPYYAVSEANGHVDLRDVPFGRYRLHFWAENVDLQQLNALSRDIAVDAPSKQLGRFDLETGADRRIGHKNKFGEDYAPVPRENY